MLSDLERELLRILHALTNMRQFEPTMTILEKKTGYRRGDILKALEGLERERYIEWPLHQVEEIKVIEGWKRESPAPARLFTKSNDLAAWFR